MDFPATALVKQLDLEHPEYAFFKGAYDQISLLYQGGTVMSEAVRKDLFLVQNTKELPEVYATRKSRFSYTNLLGNVIGWYIAALFKESPLITKRLAGVEGEPALTIPETASAFCSAFEDDCDRSGTSFVDFLSNAAEAALLYRKAYICVDIPAPSADDPPATLLQQQTGGLLNPYLVCYTPKDVINWATDAYGNFLWIVIKITVQDQGFLEDSTSTTYWYYFDQQQVALYQREQKDGAQPGSSTGESSELATLAPGYPRPHSMATLSKVPIRVVALREGLWLANRVLLPLINHLNQDNALDFCLFQANLPQLVIEDGEQGRYEEPVNFSVVAYHQLPHGGRMFFLEPEGKAYEASQNRIDNLEERIYKACYLTDQARTNKSTPTAQSGISKQMDKMPSRDALSGVGSVIRAAAQKIYDDTLAIAGLEAITPDVRGLDFSDKATADDMALIEQSTVIPVSSPRFEREIQKKNVRLALPDANSETIDEIDAEIDANPTASEVQAQQEEAQRQASIAQFTASMQAAQTTLPQGQ